MKLITALAALSLVVVGSLSPAQAQEKVVLENLGISFKTVPGYDIVSPEKLDSGIDFELRGQWSKSKLGFKSANRTVTVHIVDGMLILSLPPDRTGLVKPGEFPDADAKTLARIFEVLIPGFVVQKTAKTKLSGHDTLAVLFSLDVPEANDEVTGRLLFVPTKSRPLLIIFGTTNEQWDLRSKDFDTMLSTLKFLDDKPAPGKPTTTTKTPPAKPVGKKKG